MTLKERLEADLKAAMMARDALRTSCLRLVKTAITFKEVEAARKDLDDSGVMAVLTSLKKRAMESIEQFKLGNRPDLVLKEQKELAIIESYLPAPLGEAELAKIIDEAISEANAAGPKDMGAVMKLVMPKVAGSVDGKVVSALVQEKLKHKVNAA